MGKLNIFAAFSKDILYLFTTVGVMSADCLDVHSQGDSLTPSVTPSIPHATTVVGDEEEEGETDDRLGNWAEGMG